MPGLTLVIGNRNYSSWSLRPWIFMKHHGMTFEEKRILLSTDTTADELGRYNSGLKVPVLLDGDRQIWDSLAILEYLSERYLDNRGWPANIAARALARSVSAEMHSSFPNLRNELPMNCRKSFDAIELSEQASREVERISSLWRMCRDRYADNGDWLFGEFSIADAMYIPVALRFAGYHISLDDTSQRYVDTVLSDPGVIAWTDASRQETEIIAEDEIGMTANATPPGGG